MKKFLMLLFCVLTVYTICVLWVTSDIELNVDYKSGIIGIGAVVIMPVFIIGIECGWIKLNKED